MNPLQPRTMILILPHFLLLGCVMCVQEVLSKENETFFLQKMTQGLCVMDDNESAIYVNPPVPVASKNRPIILKGADWKIKNSLDSFQGPVTDKRWEEFPVEYTNYFRFTTGTSMALSVFADQNLEIEIYIADDEVMDYVSSQITGSEKWIHFTILVKDEAIYTYKGDELIRETFNITREQVVVKSSEKAFWRKHEYQWSSSESTGSYPYSSSLSCLMLYVSLCAECFLKIVKPDNREILIEPNNSTELKPHVMESWQFRKIEIDAKETKAMVFFKGKYNESAVGKWELDIRTCPEIRDGKAIFDITLPQDEINKTRECNTLNNNNNNNNEFHGKRSKRNTNTELFTCEPGLFGNACAVKCSNVVGRKHCEEYKICEKGQCACAWGYEGSLCESPCLEGTWGMNCLKTCPQECENSCDKLTVHCGNQKTTISMTPGVIYITIIVLAVMSSAVAGAVVWRMKLRKQGVRNGSEGDVKLEILDGNKWQEMI